MAFTDDQRRALQAKLSYRHVKTRASNGTMIPYVEGWHVIAEANRIFGYDCWDRKTIAPRCVWSELERGQTVCFYTTKVRVTVRAAGEAIQREGIGTGVGRSAQRELAHEIALKTAETDATKRALATFGNPFGLALYDKERSQVTRSGRAKRAMGQQDKDEPSASLAAAPTPLVLHARDGRQISCSAVDDYVGTIVKLVPQLPTLEDLYGFWEANIEGFRHLRARHVEGERDPVAAIISVLKARARALGGATQPQIEAPARPLAIPKEQRLRSKAHLAFVAKQPCLICGRRPSHAHHLRFAQPRAMALKVSDEFTVPVCSSHHDELHRTGDERAWWARHGVIEPLKFAGRLWAASRLKPLQDDDEVSDLEATPPSQPPVTDGPPA